MISFGMILLSVILWFYGFTNENWQTAVIGTSCFSFGLILLLSDYVYHSAQVNRELMKAVIVTVKKEKEKKE